MSTHRAADPDAGPSGRDGTGQVPGAEAERPTAIPARGWLQVTKRAWAEAKSDHVPLLAGGVAFFGFLALFPAIIAMVSVYGMVSSPKDVAKQVDSFAENMPSSARRLLVEQMSQVSSNTGKALGIGLLISLVAALWSASGGAMNLIKAVNVAYDEDETRGFLKLRGTALTLTLGAIVFFLLALGLVAAVPVVLNSVGLGTVGTILAQVARWVLLVVLVTVGLALVYRVAPDRDAPQMRWVSVGAAVATVLWIIGSLAFSFYVSNFGSYNKTYGTIAAVAVLMLWLYLSAYIVLLGAEINAEAEHQTMRDTTVGDAQPMGTRGAYVADTMPDAAAATERRADVRR